MRDFDLTLILASAITFLVALAILWRLAYKPLLGMMRDRAVRIASDMDAAEAARREAKAIEKRLEEEMAGIRARADEVLGAAARDGEKMRQAILDEARAQSSAALKRSQEMIEHEKAKARDELRGEVAELSYLMAERILGQAVERDPGIDGRLVEQAAREAGVKR